jgi:hypothetical protein
VLDGGVVRAGADRGGEAVVLADRHTGRIGYALLDCVIAVELHNPQPFRHVLTGGRVPADDAAAIRLELQREFAYDGDFPVHVDWETVAASGPQLRNLAGLLGELRDAIAKVRADDVGRQAWDQAGLLRVGHRAGAGLSVQRTPDGLAVQVDLAAALPREMAGELYRVICALL